MCCYDDTHNVLIYVYKDSLKLKIRISNNIHIFALMVNYADLEIQLTLIIICTNLICIFLYY